MSSFSVTFDYRCPFARIAHLHILDGLAQGADWKVHFSPFSLTQAKVEESDPGCAWQDTDSDTGLLALEVSMAVRDHFPEAFNDLHRNLFNLRHVDFGSLASRDDLSGAIEGSGLSAKEVFELVDTKEALKTVQREHEASVAENSVWGVPTFIANGQAAFVRLMDEPSADGKPAIEVVNNIINMLQEWPQLNEFKHTTLDR